MSLVLDTGTMKYRENPNQPWRPLVIKANMNWESMADTYDPDNGTYEIGQYVLEEGMMYRCISEITTPEAWTPAHWTSVNVGDELYALGNTLTQLKTDTFGNINLTGTNNTGSTITAGTFFYNNGTLVRAKADIQNGSAITIGTNAETVTAGGLNAVNSQIGNVVDTSTTLQGLHEGVNAFVLNSNVVIGGVTISNKLRGYAVYNKGVVVGFGVNYNATEFYTLGASGSNVWQYAKAW